MRGKEKKLKELLIISYFVFTKKISFHSNWCMKMNPVKIKKTKKLLLQKKLVEKEEEHNNKKKV